MTGTGDIKRRKPRNPALEQALGNLERVLSTQGAAQQHDQRCADPLLILGVGRSGSTLLLQYLAASGAFAYPSNVISRFYMRPALGELVQDLFLNPALDHDGEFGVLRANLPDLGFESDLGKTATPLEPSEFWYFWRRFFDFESGEPIPEGAFGADPCLDLRDELAEWSLLAGKPVALKATIAAWTLEAILKVMPEARVLAIQRDPFDTMISLLNARMQHWTSVEGWYGLKLPAELRGIAKTPLEEVALQVAAFDEMIERCAADGQVDLLDYAAFCRAPELVWQTSTLRRYAERERIDHSAARARLHGVRFKARRPKPDRKLSFQHVDESALRRLYARYREEIRESGPHDRVDLPSRI